MILITANGNRERWRRGNSRLRLCGLILRVNLESPKYSEFTLASTTKEDAEIHVHKCRLESSNSESSKHGSETGVHL
jgi:hypothetical protein